MIPALGRSLRILSTIFCVILVLWFAVFAVDQTKSASGHQQRQLQGQSITEEEREEEAQKLRDKKKSSIHKALDDVAESLTSPFKNLVSDNSEWLKNGELLLAALLVYGFGLGFLARVLRTSV